MTEVLQICQINNLPVFMSVATENSSEGTVYKNMVFSGTANYINLANDRIRKHMLVANDYEVVPAREVAVFDVGDFE